MSATETATAFRWRIIDPADPRWSRWHDFDDDCSGCCCRGPVVCSECGGREHQEPAEARTTFDTAHDSMCQTCREDICGDPIETEEQR